uniref:Potassium transporter n=1 Tax=Oryza punctata TaxID=4537 RepID=A0A0E0JT88_ORYPU
MVPPGNGAGAGAGNDVILELSPSGDDWSHEQDDDVGANGGGNGDAPPRRTFSFGQAYKTRHRQPQVFTVWQTLVLGYQSLGIVYGDLGTSPLYVFPSVVLPDADATDFLGILSLIIWTLTLMSLVKYALIVLKADDHGEGGTFALYSLLRQHVNFKGNIPVPLTRLESDVHLKFHSKRRSRPSQLQLFLENSSKAQQAITVIVLLDAVLSIWWLHFSLTNLHGKSVNCRCICYLISEHVVVLSAVILVLLFLVQRFGTSRVSFTFSPIMLLWFASIAGIGVYNIVTYHPPILKAVSPHYIYYYFAKNKRVGWEQLGAVILCITGAEALFADMGHFNKSSIQVAFSTAVFPSLILAYSGQAAYLIKNPGDLSTAFYSSIPAPLFWPMFIVSTLAAIVASQSLISASYSIIRQSIALGCFPRTTVKHTSDKYEGQVYCPEINYVLMVVCVLITVGFQGGPEIGRAFGVAVIWVMLLTTMLMTVVMIVIWEVNGVLAGGFFGFYLAIEGTYMTSLMTKVPQGGWVPFAITAVFLTVTLSWTYGRKKKREYEERNMVGDDEFAGIVSRSARVPGMCFFCTDLMDGVPPIVRHYAGNTGSLRELLLFVTFRTLPVRTVLAGERFLVAREARAGVYRCIVQYGYMDEQDMVGDDFVRAAVATLVEVADSGEEAEMIERAPASGVSYVLGRTVLRMRRRRRNWLKRFVINELYRFLQKNFRSNVSTLKLDHAKTLQVGMIYEI